MIIGVLYTILMIVLLILMIFSGAGTVFALADGSLLGSLICAIILAGVCWLYFVVLAPLADTIVWS
jgi:hypothetical protein